MKRSNTGETAREEAKVQRYPETMNFPGNTLSFSVRSMIKYQESILQDAGGFREKIRLWKQKEK